ncbi:MAG: threonylcarbamoyl-AMP synthase [Cephaloticoccus sp.]|nr:threonylcarbamoyl-AMP synthase [Cephaloticoccus sp.]MCF7761012.1 threonylcarbamoyl-AMP synthase [Cephaloticoccus sp.]
MTSSTTARIYRGTPRNLAMLANQLRKGRLVAVPTETVYGLAANALDPRACRRIFRAKGRPTTDPLIIHIHHLDQLEVIAKSNPTALRLAEAYWPGPLTLILPKMAIVPDLVTAGLDSVAVRIPRHALLRRLLKKCGLPLAAPSANTFGYISPTTADHVRSGLGRKIRHILNGGPCVIGLESTIVDVRNPDKIQVLRPGAITAAQLSATLGVAVAGFQPKPAKPGNRQLAPGLLSRHYSPKTKMFLHRTLSVDAIAKFGTSDAVLCYAKPNIPIEANIFWLDEKGDQEKAAHRLFDRLRFLDDQGYAAIQAEMAPPGPLAEAINDRLRRAANRD